MLRAIKKIRMSWPVAVLVILYIYIVLHIFGGQQGVFKLAANHKKIRTLTQDLARVQQNRRELEHRAANLRASHIDPDLLEEIARAKLNISYPNEYVIWLDEKN